LVQKEAPTISTVYLTQQEQPEENIYLDKPSPWTAGFDPRNYGGSVPRAVKAAGGKIWSPLYSDIDPHSVAEAHSLGLPVIVWTVNNPEDMVRLIDMGVDGIISDRPDVLRAVAATKDITLPRPAPVSP
jgi:glycerophosphoryl diester phosphodiesterase